MIVILNATSMTPSSLEGNIPLQCLPLHVVQSEFRGEGVIDLRRRFLAFTATSRRLRRRLSTLKDTFTKSLETFFNPNRYIRRLRRRFTNLKKLIKK